MSQPSDPTARPSESSLSPDLKRLLEELKDPGFHKRWSSQHSLFEAIGNLGDRRACGALLEVIAKSKRDPTGYAPNAEYAQEALERLGLGRLAELTRRICLPYSWERPPQSLVEEVRRLGAHGEKGIIQLIVDRFPEGFTRMALAAIGQPAVPGIVKRLRQEQGFPCSALCELLGEIGGELPVVALQEVADGRSQDARNRLAAIEALVALHDDSAGPRLVQFARSKDPDDYDRVRLCAALGQFGGHLALKALLEIVGDDPSGKVRSAACEALGDLGDGRAVPALVRRLRDSSCGYDARRALKKLGEKRCGEIVERTIGRPLNGEWRQELLSMTPEKKLWAMDLFVAVAADEHSGTSRRVTAQAAQGLLAGDLRHLLRELLCPTDFTRFVALRRLLRRVERVYCPVCQKAGGALLGAREVVAVLDAGMAEEYVLADGVFRGNWLKHPRVFDFERVEIVKATDDDVTRLCMEIKKDLRDAHYRRMLCLLHPQAGLADGTLRKLRNTFREVRPVEEKTSAR